MVEDPETDQVRVQKCRKIAAFRDVVVDSWRSANKRVKKCCPGSRRATDKYWLVRLQLLDHEVSSYTEIMNRVRKPVRPDLSLRVGFDRLSTGRAATLWNSTCCLRSPLTALGLGN